MHSLDAHFLKQVLARVHSLPESAIERAIRTFRAETSKTVIAILTLANFAILHIRPIFKAGEISG